MGVKQVEVKRTEKFWVFCAPSNPKVKVSKAARGEDSSNSTNKGVGRLPAQTARDLGSSALPDAMELRAPSASYCDVKACLVAFGYAGATVPAKVVVDESAPELQLSNSEVVAAKGLNAVLR